MVISDSETTEVAAYAGDTIPLMSLLEKNVVADQMAWDEAFPKEQNEPNLVWDDDEDEGDDRDEGDNQTKIPNATHISCGPVLEGTTIDQGAHTPNPNPSSCAEDNLWSSVQNLVGKPTSSAPSQQGARDDTNVQSPKDMLPLHAEAFVASASHERTSKLQSERSVRFTKDSEGLDRLHSPHGSVAREHSRPSSVQQTIRTSIEIPSKGFQGSEGSPRTTRIKTTVEGAIHSMAKSGPLVGPDAP